MRKSSASLLKFVTLATLGTMSGVALGVGVFFFVQSIPHALPDYDPFVARGPVLKYGRLAPQEKPCGKYFAEVNGKVKFKLLARATPTTTDIADAVAGKGSFKIIYDEKKSPPYVSVPVKYEPGKHIELFLSKAEYEQSPCLMYLPGPWFIA